MASALIKYFWRTRRWLLMNLVPEFVWPVEVNIDGVAIKVRHSPYSFATRRILINGNYEVSERKLLSGIISPGDIVFEMGGSIGIITAILEKMVGSQGKVFSVEASAKLTAYSRNWLEKKGNIQVLTGFGFPVYDCAGRIHIKSFDESAGALAGIVSFETSISDQRNNSCSSNVYDIKTIADTFHVSPDILVIDIEGSEKAILYDSMKLIDSLRFFLMELHPHLYGEAVMKAIIKKVESLGFLIHAKEANTYLFKNIIQ